MTTLITPAQLNDPSFAETHESQLDQAILQTPENPDLYMLKAVCLLHRGDYETAKDVVLTAIGFTPSRASYYVTLASCYALLDEPEKELDTYAHAYSLSKTVPSLNWNYSHALLRAGNYELGWELYRWRKIHLPNHTRFVTPDLTQIENRPCWGTLLIYAEQGLGDQVMCLPYISLIASHYETVVYESSPELYTLICENKKSLGIDHVYIRSGDGSTDIDFDHHCSTMDLPLLTLPLADAWLTPTTKFLTAKPNIREQWGNALTAAKLTGKKIGINWRGSPNHPNDKKRSANLEDFAPLAKLGSLVSLDLGEQIEATFNVNYVKEGMVNASFTAGLLANLDVVVTVDSFVAHLAGAMGIKTYLCLPYLSEWRWGNGDKALYKSVTLVRQGKDKTWAPVLEKVTKMIENEE